MEVINDLLNYNNLKIYQNTEWFNFSLDSVLLANFVKIRKNDNIIVDFGTGNAPIPLILSTKSKNKIIGIEIQKEIFDLAKKSIEFNNLENQIEIYNEDIKKVDKIIDYKVDIVISNPPFFKTGEKSNINFNEIKSIARHEIKINLNELVEKASSILKNNGVFYMVHRPERIGELFHTMTKYNLEIKEMKFIYPKKQSEANMVLIKAIKLGKKGVKVLAPIYIHKNNGEYTDKVKALFS